MSGNSTVLRKAALLQLLEIKDSDIRISTLNQGFSAVDRGIHIGGAFSAIAPLVSLYYGGFISPDIEDPTRAGQDLFVLSKGHAVAAMAAIYSDLGYFDKKILTNSRSAASILNGHPGPTLPGVQIATGPLGHGFSVAQGFAIAGKGSPAFDVFCMTGDGELQEGIVWETFMHAPQKRLDNLCVFIDKNEGQLDDSSKLAFSMSGLPRQIESFGWRVINLDGTSFPSIVSALEEFRYSTRDGRPTAIICNTRKGFGAFSGALNKHKVTLSLELYEQELSLQTARRQSRESAFFTRFKQLVQSEKKGTIDDIHHLARDMNLSINWEKGTVSEMPSQLRLDRVPERNKKLKYNPEELPRYGSDESVQALKAISESMKIFARDPRLVSVDSDLGSASGLNESVGFVDQQRALNVGIAEANMMCIGEAFAALGYNAWVSTFCPFFNWNVLRRIAVGEQERREVISSESGWLSEGHNLDMTFLATASNFDTGVNGATHMGNDDVTVFGAVAGLRIIDVSCPNQLVSIMRWIMEGQKGLIYLRIMRAVSAVLYEPGTEFSFGSAHCLYGPSDAEICLISSGRGVHEILRAAKMLKGMGIKASVYDMPSYDGVTMKKLIDSEAIVLIAEQNNGMLWNQLGRMVLQSGMNIDPTRVLAANTCRHDGSPRYIHSATYDELLLRYGLDPEQIVKQVLNRIK